MTGSKATHATGTAQNEHDLRRRNVPAKQENGQAIEPEDDFDDEKKSLKVKTQCAFKMDKTDFP